MNFLLLPCRRCLLLSPSSSVGESAADGRGGLGEMVRPGLQHQGGGGGHRRGRVPVPGRHRGAVRRPEAPPGPALLRILLVSVCLWDRGGLNLTPPERCCCLQNEKQINPKLSEDFAPLLSFCVRGSRAAAADLQ